MKKIIILVVFCINVALHAAETVSGYNQADISSVLESITQSEWDNINNRLVASNLLVSGADARNQIKQDVNWLAQNGFQNSALEQILYRVMREIYVLSESDFSEIGYDHQFEICINSKRYRIDAKYISGFDCSPFDINFETDVLRYTIEREEDGLAINFLGTFHDMVSKYAFYGGEGSWHRISPKKLVDFFGVKPVVLNR